jgi:outer membrane protein OmpA-like peptidoglycan-associated protein
MKTGILKRKINETSANSFFLRKGEGGSFFKSTDTPFFGDNAAGAPNLQKQADASNTSVVDTCKNTSTAEAQWASQNPGKIFGVEDAVEGSQNSNEFIFWNYCVGEATMRDAHKKRLQEIAARWLQLLSKDASLKVKILGSASSSGNADSNKALSLERANGIKNFLISQQIPANRIVIDTTTAPRSLAPETSPENMARNRRVEFFLFKSTPIVSTLPPWVDVDVKNLVIKKPKRATPSPVFNFSDNTFARVHPAMEASADITLTSLGGTGVGFAQVLYDTKRMAQYNVPNGNTSLLLNYGNCEQVPCKDSLNATSDFAIDDRSLFLNKPGTASKKIAISDRPGTVFPIHHPDAKKGPFELTNYFWMMRFVVVLGAKEMGAFIPLHHAFWDVTASEAVNVSKKKVTGLAPVSLIGDWVAGAPPGFNLQSIFEGPTCRFATRGMQIGNAENVCRPMETLI